MSDLVFKKSALGSVYSIAVSAITLVLGFTRTILLMRLLGADNFGVLTLALFFSKLILPFSSMGLDHALLQKRQTTPENCSTHFILRTGFSFIFGLLCLGIAPILRIGYEEQLVTIFLLFVLINLLDSTYATHFVILRREMRFGAVAMINLCASVLMTIVTPLVAYWGAGVWSLVIEQALGSMVRWFGVWIILRPWKASLHLNIDEAHSQIKFGSQVVLGNVLGTILDRFDDFWIGTVMGSSALGYYSRAYELTQYPERILSSPISSVFISAYASLQDKRQDISKLFSHSSNFLVRAGLLICAVLFTTTPELVTLVFTPRWLPIVPIFRLMTIYIALDPIYINFCSLLVGIGHPKLLYRVRIFQVLIFIFAVIILAEIWGTNGVAIAADTMMVIGVLLLILVSRQFVQISLLRMWLLPSIAAILACLVGYVGINGLSLDSSLVQLFAKIAAVSMSYMLILLCFEYKDIRKFGFASFRSVIENLKLYTRK
jgi:O-antigen/teichoic acid export membrane protein